MDINDCLKALDDGTQIVTTTFGWLEKWQEQSHSQGFNAAIDKAVEAIHKVIEDTGIPQDFDMNDLLDIEHDIEEELKKLKENI